MNHKSKTVTTNTTYNLTLTAIVAALYVVLTLMIAPISYGAIQFRISESLNYLGLHNKRYIYAVTLGVFIANYAQYGVLDMIIGSLSTFVFLWIGRYLGNVLSRYLVEKAKIPINPWIIRYVTLAVVFSFSMFTIAGMLIIVGAEAAFWPVYLSLVLSELAAMTLGGIIIYLVKQRIDFDR